jgi:hypothetical protein
MKLSTPFSLIPAVILAACGGSSDVAPQYIPVAGTAGVCFNPALYVAGNSFRTSSLVTYPGLGTAQLGNSTTIDGPSTFNENVVTKTSEVETSTPDSALVAIGSPAYTRSVSHYFLSDDSIPSLKLYGEESTSGAANGPRIEYTFKTTNIPYIETRFNLVSGQKFIQSYEQNTVIQQQPNGTSVTRKETYIKEILFSGVEAVTVPAGTFQACKFVETGAVTSSATSITLPTDTLIKWVGVGNGLPIKSVTLSESASSVTVELTSAAINGAAVTP